VWTRHGFIVLRLPGVSDTGVWRTHSFTPQQHIDQRTNNTQTVFLFVFNSFFAIGWLGMTWLYPAEITPLSIRAPANAISTTANWAFSQ
jgi:hypothetical protein